MSNVLHASLFLMMAAALVPMCSSQLHPPVLQFKCHDNDSHGECEEPRIVFLETGGRTSPEYTLTFKHAVTLENKEECSFYHLHRSHYNTHNLGFMSRCRKGSGGGGDLFEGSLLNHTMHIHVSHFGNGTHFLTMEVPGNKAKGGEGEEEDDEVKTDGSPRGLFSWPTSPVTMDKATIELAVVVDSVFMAKFNDDESRVTRMVEQIVNAADAIFAQVDIKVELVDLRFLSASETKSLLTVYDYSQYLRKIAKFVNDNLVSNPFSTTGQQQQQSKNKMLGFPDAVMTLIGRSLATDPKAMTLRGKAMTGGACSPYAHAIVLLSKDEDRRAWNDSRSALLSRYAKTAAHELAHLVGILHLDDYRLKECGCSVTGKDFCLMKVKNPFFNGRFSNCSVQNLSRRIKSNRAECLYRKNVFDPSFNLSAFEEQNVIQLVLECTSPDSSCDHQNLTIRFLQDSSVKIRRQVVRMPSASSDYCDHFQNELGKEFLFLQVCTHEKTGSKVVSGILHHSRRRRVITMDASNKIRMQLDYLLERDSFLKIAKQPHNESLGIVQRSISVVMAIERAIAPEPTSSRCLQTVQNSLFIANLLKVIFDRISIPLHVHEIKFFDPPPAVLLQPENSSSKYDTLLSALKLTTTTQQPDIVLILYKNKTKPASTNSSARCPSLIELGMQSNSLTLGLKFAHEIGLSFGLPSISSEAEINSCECITTFGSCIMRPEVSSRGVLWSTCSVHMWKEALAKNMCIAEPAAAASNEQVSWSSGNSVYRRNETLVKNMCAAEPAVDKGKDQGTMIVVAVLLSVLVLVIVAYFIAALVILKRKGHTTSSWSPAAPSPRSKTKEEEEEKSKKKKIKRHHSPRMTRLRAPRSSSSSESAGSVNSKIGRQL